MSGSERPITEDRDGFKPTPPEDGSLLQRPAFDAAISTMVKNVRIATSRKSAPYHFPWLRPGYMMQFHEIERAVLGEIRRCFGSSLHGLKVLDIGCGGGGWLREFIKWGAQPEFLYGIDAIEERIAEARRLTPAGVRLILGNAASLEFDNDSFDIVMMFECLCIMTDEAARKKMAAEALRVVKPTGAILFYDFRYRRPRLGDVLRPLGKREIKHLFPECKYHLQSIHPFPPLSRKLAAITPGAWHLLNPFLPLRTSYAGSIKKSRPYSASVEKDRGSIE